jgi:predicted adenylyl cyclase CyaB
MPVNIEIKAHLNDPKSALFIADRLDVQSKDILHQSDTYFECIKGRVKLRETSGKEAELIYYDRDETDDIRRSDYEVYKIPRHSNFGAIWKKVMYIKNVVSKRRHLFVYQGNRIHIDEVDKLGWFIEFEVPVSSDKTQADRMMDNLLGIFHIQKKDIIKCSYLDLLSNKEEDERSSARIEN